MPIDNKTERLLGEISSDLKHLIAAQQNQYARIEKLNTRVQMVEQFQYKLMGVAAIMPITLSLLGMYFNHMNH